MIYSTLFISRKTGAYYNIRIVFHRSDDDARDTAPNLCHLSKYMLTVPER